MRNRNELTRNPWSKGSVPPATRSSKPVVRSPFDRMPIPELRQRKEDDARCPQDDLFDIGVLGRAVLLFRALLRRIRAACRRKERQREHEECEGDIRPREAVRG